MSQSLLPNKVLARSVSKNHIKQLVNMYVVDCLHCLQLPTFYVELKCYRFFL